MASRLCKAAMFSRFRLLAKEAERDDLLQAATYHEAKVSANRGGISVRSLLMATLKAGFVAGVIL